MKLIIPDLLIKNLKILNLVLLINDLARQYTKSLFKIIEF